MLSNVVIHLVFGLLRLMTRCHVQKTQISLSHQGKPSDRRSLLPYVSNAGLHRNRLLCCHFQRTSQGFDFLFFSVYLYFTAHCMFSTWYAYWHSTLYGTDELNIFLRWCLGLSVSVCCADKYEVILYACVTVRTMLEGCSFQIVHQSVHMSVCVALWTQYFINCSGEFYHICSLGAFGYSAELIRF